MIRSIYPWLQPLNDNSPLVNLDVLDLRILLRMGRPRQRDGVGTGVTYYNGFQNDVWPLSQEFASIRMEPGGKRVATEKKRDKFPDPCTT